MLEVRDVMTSSVFTVSPESTLRELVELLSDRHVTGVPVVSGERVVGVVSAADLLDFLASTPAVPQLREDQVEWGELGLGDENEEGDAGDAFAALLDFWADVGADAVVRFAEVDGPEWDILAEHFVGEVMTPDVAGLPPDTPVVTAARRMLEASIHRLLVLDGDRLAGIVTTTDVVRGLARGRVIGAAAEDDP